MYLYLAAEDAFDSVPSALMDRFGAPEPVMSLQLHTERKLAREDVSKVMHNLESIGYHLQMPPELKPELYHGNDL